MLPYPLKLGHVSITAYGLMLALGVLTGVFSVTQTAHLAGVSPRRALNLAFLMVICGLIGARTAYVLNNLGRFSVSPLEALKYYKGGLMFQGGLFGGLTVALILALAGRIRLTLMGDALSPGLALGQALGRLGCFLAGCCYGRPAWDSSMPALLFPPGSQAPPNVPLYPTQLIESLGLGLISFCLFLALRRPGRPAGLVLALYLASTGTLRLFVEQFRGDYRGQNILGWPPTSWAALAICLTGLGFVFTLLARKKQLALTSKKNT